MGPGSSGGGRGSVLGRLAAVLLGLFVVTACLEIALRLRSPELPCYRLDTELLHDAIPGGGRLQRMPSPVGERTVEVTFNDAGLRGPLPRSPKDGPRVLLLGDSLVLAGNTAEEQTLRAELERRLGDVEVLNAGRESYGPDQSLLWLRRRLGELDPDLVVLVLCAHNDLGDLMRNRLFRLDAAGELERERTTLARTLVEEFESRRRVEGGLHVLSWLQRRLEPVDAEQTPDPEQLLMAWLAASRAQVEDALQGPPVVVDLEHDAFDADVAIEPEGPTAKAKRALMQEVLEAMRVDLEIAGVPSLALVVPSAVDIDPDFPVRPDSSEWPAYTPSNLTHAVRDCAADAGWQVVDATPPLEDLGHAAFEPGLDFHWSAAGQAAVAAQLAPRVKALLAD